MTACCDENNSPAAAAQPVLIAVELMRFMHEATPLLSPLMYHVARHAVPKEVA